MWMLLPTLVVWRKEREGKDGSGKELYLPLDVFWVGAEIGCVVDFVLKELKAMTVSTNPTSLYDKESKKGIDLQSP